MKELDDLLQHHGIKGMKWGRRKSGGSGQSNKPKEPGLVKQHLNSMKRERQWKKVANNAHNMSTHDINRVANRIQMENTLKRLSKSNVGSKKDKQDYLRRDKMSNEELARKVTRLKARDNLNRVVNEASRSQRELGIKVATTVSHIALKRALGQSIDPKSILESTKAHPNQVKDLAIKSFLDKQAKKNRD